MKDRHSEVMSALKDRLSDLLVDIPCGSKIAFVDYPAHFNVGDLLIDRGTQAFFRHFEHQVIGRFSIGDLGRYRNGVFQAGRSIALLDCAVNSGATIVCHGGGNVGDIWPEHQLCREALMTRYPKTKFVFLPQSIHFNSQTASDRAFAEIRKHGQVSLYVRDQPSLRFAEGCAATAKLLPDMAHQLWTELDRSEPDIAQSGPLNVLRRDSEKAHNIMIQGDTFDWDDIVGLTERALLKAFQATEIAGPTLRRHFETYPLWAFNENRLVIKAVRHFNRYQTIITDRLHAMILAALLSKKVEFHDNSYGKLSRYFEAFLGDSPLVSRAS